MNIVKGSKDTKVEFRATASKEGKVDQLVRALKGAKVETLPIWDGENIEQVLFIKNDNNDNESRGISRAVNKLNAAFTASGTNVRLATTQAVKDGWWNTVIYREQ